MAHVVALFNPGAWCSTRSGTKAVGRNAFFTGRPGLSGGAGMAARSGALDVRCDGWHRHRFQRQRVDLLHGRDKRHWGAYGNRPDYAAARTISNQGPGDPQFNQVHHVRISLDGFVYVADRLNRRIQVFTIDGSFVREAFVRRASPESAGTVSSLAFSAGPDQRYLYVADQAEDAILVVDRQTLGGSWDRAARLRASGRPIPFTAIAVRSERHRTRQCQELLQQPEPRRRGSNPDRPRGCVRRARVVAETDHLAGWRRMSRDASLRRGVAARGRHIALDFELSCDPIPSVHQRQDAEILDHQRGADQSEEAGGAGLTAPR